jgi:predicted glycoside hydrolase/deacetylase ChbG (UPF0249 family)
MPCHRKQHSARARLIVTADDAAIDEGLDAGILELANLGALTGIAAFANRNMLKEIIKNKPLDVKLGIHFNISSGKPISAPVMVPSIVTESGYFYSPTPEMQADIEVSLLNFRTNIIPNYNESDLNTEFSAQLNAFRVATGGFPKFSTVHHDFDEIAQVSNVLRNLLPDIPTRWEKVCKGELAGVFYLFLDQHDNLNNAISKLSQMLKNAITCSFNKGGLPSEIVCHPGYISHNINKFTVYKDGRYLELLAWKSDQMQSYFKNAYKNIDYWEFTEIFFNYEAD